MKTIALLAVFAFASAIGHRVSRYSGSYESAETYPEADNSWHHLTPSRPGHHYNLNSLSDEVTAEDVTAERSEYKSHSHGDDEISHSGLSYPGSHKWERTHPESHNLWHYQKSSRHERILNPLSNEVTAEDETSEEDTSEDLSAEMNAHKSHSHGAHNGAIRHPGSHKWEKTYPESSYPWYYNRPSRHGRLYNPSSNEVTARDVTSDEETSDDVTAEKKGHKSHHHQTDTSSNIYYKTAVQVAHRIDQILLEAEQENRRRTQSGAKGSLSKSRLAEKYAEEIIQYVEQATESSLVRLIKEMDGQMLVEKQSKSRTEHIEAKAEERAVKKLGYIIQKLRNPMSAERRMMENLKDTLELVIEAQLLCESYSENQKSYCLESSIFRNKIKQLVYEQGLYIMENEIESQERYREQLEEQQYAIEEQRDIVKEEMSSGKHHVRTEMLKELERKMAHREQVLLSKQIGCTAVTKNLQLIAIALEEELGNLLVEENKALDHVH